MTFDSFFEACIAVALFLLVISFLVIIVRIVKGPTLPDRILGLDMLVGAGIGFIAVIGLKTGYTLYLDIAIALGLVGFLATVAFARFVLHRGQASERSDTIEVERPVVNSAKEPQLEESEGKS